MIRDIRDDRSCLLLCLNDLHCISIIDRWDICPAGERLHCKLVTIGNHPKFHTIAFTGFNQLRDTRNELWSDAKDA